MSSNDFSQIPRPSTRIQNQRSETSNSEGARAVEASRELQKSFFVDMQNTYTKQTGSSNGLPADWKFNLEIVQQPIRARACGYGNKMNMETKGYGLFMPIWALEPKTIIFCDSNCFIWGGSGQIKELAVVDSDKFKVFRNKLFPGVVECSQLTKCFVKQGANIPLRNEAEKFKNTAHSSGGELDIDTNNKSDDESDG
ncbi:40239_t:CDS:2, partial [Gigaspora margarita]